MGNFLVFLLLCSATAIVRIPGPGGSTATADTEAVTGFTPGTLRSNFTSYVGMSFDAAADKTVTALGHYVTSGSTHTHQLTFTDNTGVSLGTCTVDSTGQPVGYQYCSVTPFAITNGTTYFMFSGEASGGDDWYDSDTTITTTADITLNGAEYCGGTLGANCLSPASGTGSPNSFGPVNFKYH